MQMNMMEVDKVKDICGAICSISEVYDSVLQLVKAGGTIPKDF
ncbi:unnamed protein product [Nyctereutes procyonoides]|uniref:(raccoon dog) hypothetical protein n=1 Tax=Nyctereutes procyonoides TaxID=34880 RepID=A0A811YWT9_NYCPR|nr:unnamed protein product [Nyctereutes procyonoides]